MSAQEMPPLDDTVAAPVTPLVTPVAASSEVHPAPSLPPKYEATETFPGESSVGASQNHYLDPKTNNPIVTSGTNADGVTLISVRNPIKVYCRKCNDYRFTVIKRTPGCATGCWSAILLFVCWPLACLPCLCPICWDQYHYCETCGDIIAVVPA